MNPYRDHASRWTRLQSCRLFCCRFQAKRKRLEKFQGLLPERQGQNLAMTVLYVPHSLDNGRRKSLCHGGRDQPSHRTISVNQVLPRSLILTSLISPSAQGIINFPPEVDKREVTCFARKGDFITPPHIAHMRSLPQPRPQPLSVRCLSPLPPPLSLPQQRAAAPCLTPQTPNPKPPPDQNSIPFTTLGGPTGSKIPYTRVCVYVYI